MDQIHFPPRELAVMSVLWRHGSATVSQVRDELDEDLAYTSVLSALQTREEKGYVRHESEGRAYRYYPLVASEEAGGSAIRLTYRTGFLRASWRVNGGGLLFLATNDPCP